MGNEGKTGRKDDCFPDDIATAIRLLDVGRSRGGCVWGI